MNRVMNKRVLVSVLFALLALAAAASAQDDFRSIPDAKFTDVNRIGIMINNNGFLGTNLSNAQSPPSFEYPLGTDIERMIRGGLWLGAIDGNFDKLVTTATQDISFATSNISEWRDGPLIIERSILRNNAFFSHDAVSEQDYICLFDDLDSTITSDHRPMKMRVTLRTYAWSFQPVDEMVILSYTLENVGDTRLEDIYIGINAELISCSKSTNQRFPNICFDRKHYEYDEEFRLMGCRFWDKGNSLLPGWGGFSILGSLPESIAGKDITYNWWEWDPGIASRQQDDDRYDSLSIGTTDSTVTDNPTDGGTPDPVGLLAVGPFRVIDPGDTLNVVFAAVGGRDWEDFKFHAGWALRTFESGYQIPLPPPSPRLHVEPGPNSVKLFWDASPETIPDPVLEDSLDFQGYRVYMSRDNVEFVQVGEYDLIDTIGYNIGLAPALLDSPLTFDGDTTSDGDPVLFLYSQEIPSLKDGFEYFLSVTSFDRGSKEQGVPSLESGISQNRSVVIPGPSRYRGGGGKPPVTVFPNPYRGEAVWDGRFARERLIYFANIPERCTIRIYTVAGDLVDEIEFDADTYHGANAAAIFDPDFSPPELSGGIAAWDLLTNQDQTIASGLYVYSVEDHVTGDHETGKFVVIR